jgi:hypothetical protein
MSSEDSSEHSSIGMGEGGGIPLKMKMRRKRRIGRKKKNVMKWKEKRTTSKSPTLSLRGSLTPSYTSCCCEVVVAS